VSPSLDRVGEPPFFGAMDSGASVLARVSPGLAARRPAGGRDESALLVPRRVGSSPFGRISSHQPVDGVPPPPPKMGSRHSGNVGHLGQGHAEHSRRVEDGGIGDCQAVAGRIDEGSGQ